ncbi:MAG TPA: type VI secretion system tip protein TssI/VgrG, partial [Polyangiaceae bacterium]|nr:type VI secretion system tip protein TssI/VgrG [Polyangiaceae bacterium]
MDHFVEVSLLSSVFECLRVLFAEEHHQLMFPARAQVRAALNQVPPLDEIIGSQCLLHTQRSGEEPRLFYGIITEARLCATPVLDARSRVAPTYEFLIESQLGLAEHIQDCRIFQPTDQSKNTTQDIVSALLAELGVATDQQDWQLSGSYVPREYCVQYRESTLNFITRLLEDEGISLAIDTAPPENKDEPPKTIYRFFDDSTSTLAMPSEAVPVRAASGQNEQRSAVYGIDGRRGVAPGRLTLRSFDFTRPTLAVEGESTGTQFDDLELYGVSQYFVEPSHGSALALVRQGEQETAAHGTLVTTDSLGIRAGSRFDVSQHGETQSYFVTELRTSYRYSERDRGNQSRNYYLAEALVQPLAVPYRPGRVHPAPRIFGPQTATIVAKPGTEPEGVETDKYGRVKVQFHWDRYGKLDDKSSCWMRVAQLQTSGSMVLPRIDWEVVVEFLDGNPDHPMVAGRLFNGRFMPPYELPAGRTRTSLQSASSPAGGGKNEIRFEDAAGAEELMVHSQYNTVINAANNRKKNITKDETLVIGNNANAEVGGNQTVKVTGGCEHAIKGNQT